MSMIGRNPESKATPYWMQWRTVGLSEPSVRDRLQRLEHDGVIAGYHAALDPASADAGTCAFVALRFGSGEAAKAVVNERLGLEPCVLEVHEVAGEDCYLLKMRVAGTSALAGALDRIRAIPPVISTSTTIVLRTLFERPLGVVERPAGAEPGQASPALPACGEGGPDHNLLWST